MKDVRGIVTAECVVPEIAKPRKSRRAIELALGETKNVFVIILAHRSSVIGQQVKALFEPALKSDLDRVVVSCAVRVQIITVLREGGKGQVRRLGGPGRKKQVWNVSLLPVEQVVSIVPDVGDSNGLALRQLILDRSVPLLRIGRLPGAVESNESQTIGTEVRACWIGTRCSEPVFERRLLSVGIKQRKNVAIRLGESKGRGEWVVVAGIWRSAEVLESAIEHSVSATSDKLGCELIRQSNSGSKICQWRRENT